MIKPDGSARETRPGRLRKTRRRQVATLAAAVLVWIAAPTTRALATEPYDSCIGSKCYPPDFLGGLGLKPRRRYEIVFGTDPICTTVRDAVNAAIRAGAASRRKVERPLPAEALAAASTWPWRGQAVTTWETKNPIFASDIFLPWNWVAYTPFPPSNHELNPDLLKDDFSRSRWLIAPIFNDGRPLLLTQAPKEGVYVWDVPEAELGKHDWSNWRSYASFSPLVARCDGKPYSPNSGDLATSIAVGPLDRYGSRCQLTSDRGGPMFPNLSKEKQESEPFRRAGRVLSLFTFAKVRERYFGILQTPDDDTLTVVDLGDRMPPPLEYGSYRPQLDLCYLQPTLLAPKD